MHSSAYYQGISYGLTKEAINIRPLASKLVTKATGTVGRTMASPGGSVLLGEMARGGISGPRDFLLTAGTAFAPQAIAKVSPMVGKGIQKGLQVGGQTAGTGLKQLGAGRALPSRF